MDGKLKSSINRENIEKLHNLPCEARTRFYIIYFEINII